MPEQAATKPKNARINLEKVVQQKAKLSDARDELADDRELVTIAFFDLEGSTEYRRIQGAALGLEKAMQHNVLVTQAVIEAGGHVAKWLGDGVLAYFRESDIGPHHAYTAVATGIAVIKAMEKDNSESHRNYPHDIHTRVGISSGAVHFVLGHNQAAGGSLDPIGSCVDKAARIQAMAARDVIAIDKETFFGHEAMSEHGSSCGMIAGVCQESEDQVLWREIRLERPRRTEYSPKCAVLFTATNQLEASSYVTDAGHVVEIETLQQNARKEQTTRGEKADVVFASQPILRNAKGFDVPVRVLGLALVPQLEPLNHVRHTSKDTEEIRSKIAEGEAAFYNGDIDTAAARFNSVISEDKGGTSNEKTDPRHFLANFRLAQIYHRRKQNDKAMQHVTTAKYSDNSLPIVWKLAGVIHLEDFLRSAHGREILDRAVTAFTNAIERSATTLEREVEQCGRCLLAISYFLRNGPGDADLATSEVGHVRPDSTPMAGILRPILEAFVALASGGRGGVMNARNLYAEHFGDSSKLEVPDGGIINKRDMRYLVHCLDERIRSAEIDLEDDAND